ncbi:MAG TPA: hypothetical protein VLF40_01450 [Candidatus Saccharimonadales bacterium]|nr:hypothetical protein [Candidatus Saccharimonadales bacterium]
MQRYRNPNLWVDGATVHVAIRGKMAVRITETEVRPDNAAMVAVANVACIQAWARSIALLPQDETPDVMHMPDSTSYLVVPKRHWDYVQQRLTAL